MQVVFFPTSSKRELFPASEGFEELEHEYKKVAQDHPARNPVSLRSFLRQIEDIRHLLLKLLRRDVARICTHAYSAQGPKVLRTPRICKTGANIKYTYAFHGLNFMFTNFEGQRCFNAPALWRAPYMHCGKPVLFLFYASCYGLRCGIFLYQGFARGL